MLALRELERVHPGTPVFLARELTKIHEQQFAGTPGGVRAALSDPVRGEIVLVLETVPPTPSSSAARTQGTIEAAIDAALDSGMSLAATAKAVSARTGLERGTFCKRIVERKHTCRQPAP